MTKYRPRPHDKAMADEPRIDSLNPWRTRGSREVYVNPWIRVREDHVIRADGRDGIYGVVEFQNHALGIVPVTDDGDTFLVGQWRYPLALYSWEIPEGGGPLHIPLLDSARRELAEETGLTASSWTDLGLFHLSNSVTNEAGQIFLAQDLTLGDPAPEGDEVLSLRRLPAPRSPRDGDGWSHHRRCFYYRFGPRRPLS